MDLCDLAEEEGGREEKEGSAVQEQNSQFGISLFLFKSYFFFSSC